MTKAMHRGLLLIGALKLVKALALFTVGIGLLSLIHRDVADLVRRLVEFFRLDVHARVIEKVIAAIAGINQHTMRRLGVGSLFYASVFTVEGVGLLRSKTWAEYLTTGVTISFLPLEIYELVTHPSTTKVLLVLINVAVVVYLVIEIRRRRTSAAKLSRAGRADLANGET